MVDETGSPCSQDSCASSATTASSTPSPSVSESKVMAADSTVGAGAGLPVLSETQVGINDGIPADGVAGVVTPTKQITNEQQLDPISPLGGIVEESHHHELPVTQMYASGIPAGEVVPAVGTPTEQVANEQQLDPTTSLEGIVGGSRHHELPATPIYASTTEGLLEQSHLSPQVLSQVHACETHPYYPNNTITSLIQLQHEFQHGTGTEYMYPAQSSCDSIIGSSQNLINGNSVYA